MNLSSQMISISDLESYFVDKDTGLPLANGEVRFFRDVNRIQTKDVYILTGSPGNYTYESIGSVVNLGPDGTPIYINTQVTLFYYPYDGSFPLSPSTKVDYYYVEIYSQGNVLQRTLQAVPFASLEETPINDVNNFISNTQFLGFNNSWDKVTPTPEATYQVYSLAPGGWEFAVNAADANKYKFTFTRPTSQPTVFTSFPYGFVEWENTAAPVAGTPYDFRFKIQDVLKLAQPNSPTPYTFYIMCESGDVGTHLFSVRLIKNYGTGGAPSATEDTPIGTITITPMSAYAQIQFNYDIVGAKTLGTNNNDYTAIALRQVGGSFKVKIFEAGLLYGTQTVQNSKFPATLQSTMRADAIAGWMPTPAKDGSDLYLPLRLTPSGMQFDHTEIGKIYPVPYETPGEAELICDGTSYKTTAYSGIGIPYSRLQAKLWSNTTLNTVFGTGKDFMQSLLLGVATQNTVLIHNNSRGLLTAATDGGVATTMTISNVCAGFTNTMKAGAELADKIVVYDLTVGAYPVISGAGTSPFTVTVLRDNANSPPVTEVTVTMAGLVGGQYWVLGSSSLAPTQFYYVWYKINGVGGDPAPVNGIGIQVDILSTYTATDLRNATLAAVSGFGATQLVTKAANLIPAGSYFNIYAGANLQYYVWYKVDNAGVDPAINANGILVQLNSVSDNANAVALKTITAINSFYVGVPDLRGLFIRGWDNGAGNDSTAANRLSYSVFNNNGDEIGTYQYDNNVAHNHVTTLNVTDHNPAFTPRSFFQMTDVGNPPGATFSVNSNNSGEQQTVPRNVSLNYVIKY